VPRLDAEALYRSCDPARFDFADTTALEPLAEVPGQEVATQAVRRGARMAAHGYNIFALGSPRTFKRDTVTRLLAGAPSAPDTLLDRAYVEDLSGGRRPRALTLPAGEGARLCADVDAFIADLVAALPALFDDERFRAQAGELVRSFQTEQKKRMLALQQEAEAAGLRLLQTPQGFAFAPLDSSGEGEPEVIEPEAFAALPPEEQTRLHELIDTFNVKLMDVLQALPQQQQTLMREQRALARERAATALAALLRPLRARYEGNAVFLTQLDRMADDILDQLPRLIALEGHNDPSLDDLLRRYRVNLVIDRTGVTTVPVVYESNPTVENLFGRIDHTVTPVGWQTDASMIRTGSVQQADGGYLLIDAERLLTRPLAWDALKRALMDGLAYMESPAQLFSLGGGYGLEPEPLPIRVKVVLLGSRLIYYLLSEYDPDFDTLFRIAAEFEDVLEHTPEAVDAYARWLGMLAREGGLRPLDAAAVARIVEFASRTAADVERLTAHTRTLQDVLTEADFEASERNAAVVGAVDVEAALAARLRRVGRLQRDMLDAIVRNTVLIATDGTATGQINGLSVLQIGGHSFGQPSRISATARLGGGRVIDIEREAELGGKIHSKGLLIVSSFIGARFGSARPLSLHASLVFEQSYGGVDGDSASVAEVCALLSAIAEVPLKQSLAVTGSMNQHGAVQAIGGVNEKIEGFFRVCLARGLSGDQGVIVPAANAKHLMLEVPVREAVAAGRFHVWTVEHIDEALALFTGMPTGARDGAGHYPEGSLNARVAARLDGFAEAARAFAGPGGAAAGDDEEVRR
jgi:predicted ATP-dependent protease